MKWNSKTRGRISKHIDSLMPAHRHSHTDTNNHICSVSYTHTQRPYKYTSSRNTHKHTYWHIHKQCPWERQLCSAGSWPEQTNIMITGETTVGCTSFHRHYRFMQKCCRTKIDEDAVRQCGLPNKAKWWVSILKGGIIKQTTLLS